MSQGSSAALLKSGLFSSSQFIAGNLTEPVLDRSNAIDQRSALMIELALVGVAAPVPLSEADLAPVLTLGLAILLTLRAILLVLLLGHVASALLLLVVGWLGDDSLLLLDLGLLLSLIITISIA